MAGLVEKGIGLCYSLATMAKTDDLDRHLIHLLGQNARQSSAALARKLNTSPTTVRRRTRKLIDNGTLLVVALADPRKLNLPLSVLIGVNTAPDMLDSALKALSGHAETRWVRTVTGRFDIIIFLLCHSTNELSDYVRTKLSKTPGVRNNEIYICLHTAKSGFLRL